VHFFRQYDGKSKKVADEFVKLSEEWQGVYVVAAVDCDIYEGLCEKEDVRETPMIKIYPPFPAPISTYEGEITAKEISAFASRYITGNVIELQNDNYKAWLEDKPSVPKVILFTENKGVPTIFKALSVSFQTKMVFGLARPEDNEVVSHFKVKKYPTILLHRSRDPKPHEYKDEMKFRPIFNFLNVFSETFVSGGTEEGIESKPWKAAAVPELFKQSADDICFKYEGALCAIYILNDKPSEDLVAIAKSVPDKFKSNIADRGAEIKFMWLDITKDASFASVFEGVNSPGLVFLKHGKRNRYIVHTEALSEKEISQVVDKIMGGDGKFSNIKGGLPALSDRR